jgi:hypothetical protein
VSVTSDRLSIIRSFLLRLLPEYGGNPLRAFMGSLELRIRNHLFDSAEVMSVVLNNSLGQ